MYTHRLILYAKVFSLLWIPIMATHSPHIMLVIVDDVGFADVEWNQQSNIYKLEQLMTLATNGTILSQYYAYPTCTPTRAALLTGRFAHNTGLPFPLIGKPAAGLDPSLRTLAQELQLRSYKTHLVGKWHLGHSKWIMTPTKRGFDSFFGLHGGGFNHWTKESNNCIDLFDGTTQMSHVDIDPTEHATALFTRRGVEIINQHPEYTPLFLMMSYTAPHDPLLSPKPYIKRCEHISTRRRRIFCAMMLQIDDGIKKLMKALIHRSMWDDTVFVFTSDNGGLPIVGGYNYPFRGTKGSAWEGGIRVPAFIHAPNFLDGSDDKFNDVFHISDWFPTLLSISDAISGYDGTLVEGIDGINMLDFLTKKKITTERKLVLQQDIFLNISAYRKGDMKLILGSPGIPGVYYEPYSNFSLNSETEVPFYNTQYIEYLIDLVSDHGGDPLTLTVIGYLFAMQKGIWYDYWLGTSFRQFLMKDIRNPKTTTIMLSEHLPMVEWSLDEGPRVYLFNLSADPTERLNLAYDRKELVKELAEELTSFLVHAPLQFAGDTIDSAAPMDAACNPWLPDDKDISNLKTVNERFFLSMAGKLSTVILIILLLIPGCCCCCSICCFGPFVYLYRLIRKSNHGAIKSE